MRKLVEKILILSTSFFSLMSLISVTIQTLNTNKIDLPTIEIENPKNIDPTLRPPRK